MIWSWCCDKERLFNIIYKAEKLKLNVNVQKNQTFDCELLCTDSQTFLLPLKHKLLFYIFLNYAADHDQMCSYTSSAAVTEVKVTFQILGYSKMYSHIKVGILII